MKEIKIYSLNDFHGMIFSDNSGSGISKIGDFLVNQKKENDCVIVLSAGDMFQGGSVSTLTKGEALVEAMNIIGFDAMTIGNHEFDWGIETILKYNDYNQDNGELNCKFIISNIIDKSLNEKPEWALPYTAFIKNGLKIGVLGIIGEDQEKDIIKKHVEKYEFTNEFESIKKYSYILRIEEKCDIVILCTHSDTTNINLKISNFSDDSKIDAIINGHTHQAYYGEYSDDGKCLGYVQSGSYGKYLGYIKLIYDEEIKKVISCDTININTKTFKKNNPEIDNILRKYQDYIDLSNEKMGIMNRDLDKTEVLKVLTEKLKKIYNADIAIINTGGIRNNAFPLKNESAVIYDDLFKMMPFENFIVRCDVKGKNIKNIIQANGIYSSEINFELDELKYYNVATVDFIVMNYEMLFGKYKNYFETKLLVRDFLVEIIKENYLK